MKSPQPKQLDLPISGYGLTWADMLGAQCFLADQDIGALQALCKPSCKMSTILRQAIQAALKYALGRVQKLDISDQERLYCFWPEVDTGTFKRSTFFRLKDDTINEYSDYLLSCLLMILRLHQASTRNVATSSSRARESLKPAFCYVQEPKLFAATTSLQKKLDRAACGPAPPDLIDLRNDLLTVVYRLVSLHLYIGGSAALVGGPKSALLLYVALSACQLQGDTYTLQAPEDMAPIINGLVFCARVFTAAFYFDKIEHEDASFDQLCLRTLTLESQSPMATLFPQWLYSLAYARRQQGGITVQWDKELKEATVSEIKFNLAKFFKAAAGLAAKLVDSFLELAQGWDYNPALEGMRSQAPGAAVPDACTFSGATTLTPEQLKQRHRRFKSTLYAYIQICTGPPPRTTDTLGIRMQDLELVGSQFILSIRTAKREWSDAGCIELRQLPAHCTPIVWLYKTYMYDVLANKTRGNAPSSDSTPEDASSDTRLFRPDLGGPKSERQARKTLSKELDLGELKDNTRQKQQAFRQFASAAINAGLPHAVDKADVDRILHKEGPERLDPAFYSRGAVQSGSTAASRVISLQNARMASTLYQSWLGVSHWQLLPSYAEAVHALEHAGTRHRPRKALRRSRDDDEYQGRAVQRTEADSGSAAPQ
ncbi:hypothetical protein OC835_007762, partial [Tilletia horrida]